jgi:hypothetical protein
MIIGIACPGSLKSSLCFGQGNILVGIKKLLGFGFNILVGIKES